MAGYFSAVGKSYLFFLYAISMISIIIDCWSVEGFFVKYV